MLCISRGTELPTELPPIASEDQDPRGRRAYRCRLCLRRHPRMLGRVNREAPRQIVEKQIPRESPRAMEKRLSHGLALRKSDWQKVPMRKARQAVLELAGREVVITNPDKPFFPQAGHTKLHLVRYYAAVAE